MLVLFMQYYYIINYELPIFKTLHDIEALTRFFFFHFAAKYEIANTKPHNYLYQKNHKHGHP